MLFKPLIALAAWVSLVFVTGEFSLEDKVSSNNGRKLLETYLNGYETTCYGAKLVQTQQAGFCSMVNWQTVNLYSTSSVDFTVFNPGSPLTMDQQDSVAQSISEKIIATSTSKVSRACEDAVRRFACVTAFAYCPQIGSSFSSTSFTPPCKAQCEQVKSICKSSALSLPTDPVLVQITCDAYQENHNCMLHVPEGRSYLDIEKV
jgi:hypothetical protein